MLLMQLKPLSSGGTGGSPHAASQEEYETPPDETAEHALLIQLNPPPELVTVSVTGTCTVPALPAPGALIDVPEKSTSALYVPDARPPL